MKNKKLKQNNENKENSIKFSQAIKFRRIFKCPIWFADETAFVDDLNKASDPYIEMAKRI